MTERSFQCEVLSPLFLGGADARGAPPELRAPSIRGAMRYWYRALLGGSSLLNSHDYLPKIHSLEAELFGSTDHGGALSTRLSQASGLPIESYEKDRALRTPEGNFLPTGKDYLLWSMGSTGGKVGSPRYQPARQYIKPGAKFKFILSAQLHPDYIQKGTAAFWLLTNLGALGARANRGAGSLQAQAANSPVSFKDCASIQELQSHLKRGIQDCMNIVTEGAWGTLPVNEQAEFDILHPQVCNIWVVADGDLGWDSYLQALNRLGSHFRDYRTHLNTLGKGDHDAVLGWFESGGRGPEIKRPIFGLPIPFRYSDGGPSDVIIHEKSDRRGSPLHMHITKLESGKYVGVLTLFKSRFLPENVDLKLQERKWKAPAPSDYTVATDFIKTFPVNKQVAL
jgi:CRISPR-associated protein Cmr1